MNIREAVVGTIITVVIGGTAYTINQADIVNYFAEDTGLTKQQAEQYVKDIKKEDLDSWGNIGASYINEGEQLISAATEIDCTKYTYEWESSSLSCPQAKEQVNKIGRDSISLGRAFEKLGSDSASKDDMRMTINLIDILNADYDLDMIRLFVDTKTVNDSKNTGSYNKALLKAALESD